MESRIKPSTRMKKLIKEWLRSDNKSRRCPFKFFSTLSCQFCDSWFLRRKYNVYEEKCPCCIYKLSTVKSRAKEMLRMT